jgi:hypothetical protein
MTARKCTNWLESFEKFVLPRVEAPKSFVTWTGIFALASVIKRKVYIGQNTLGGWTCWPHQYIIFVAPPGFGKTTAVKFATGLLTQVADLRASPTFLSSAAMISTLVTAKDTAIYMVVEELGDLINKTGLEMFEFLTSMYDGKTHIEATTISRGIEFVTKPTINMIAATTPQWISANMPEALIGGGFASRVTFVYEDVRRTKQMYYKKVMENNNFLKMESDLLEDLVHIATLEGEFTIEDKALEFMEDWYQNTHTTVGSHVKLLGYLERKPTQIHKVAQLVHLAYSDELILTLEDFQQAKRILETTEKNLPKVFAGVGKNVFAIDMELILKFVAEKGQVRQEEIIREFQSNAEPRMLLELIQGLQVAKRIKVRVTDEADIIYSVVEG